VTESLAARRREVIATLAIVGGLAWVPVVRAVLRRLSAHPTPERCAAMLDRYAEQEARSRARMPLESHVALDAPDVERCRRELTDAEVECALGAAYVDAIERCLP